jgi:hypothetical protein
MCGLAVLAEAMLATAGPAWRRWASTVRVSCWLARPREVFPGTPSTDLEHSKDKG